MKKNAYMPVSAAVVLALLFVWISRSSAPVSIAAPAERDATQDVAAQRTIDLASRRTRARQASPSDGGSLVLHAGWGSAPGELGRDRPSEASPSGPMSLMVDGRQRMWVLDQVNGRVTRYGTDGRPEASLAIAPDTAQDVAIADDGTVAILDRHGSEQVALHDPSGAVVGTLPLAGEGIESAGHVTGIFVDGEDVYAESEHGPLVKLGTTGGEPAEPRTSFPGRPSRDGELFLKAGITDAVAGRAYVAAMDRPSEAHRFTRELVLGSTIQSIVLLDTDELGTIYFGAEVLVDAPHTEVLVVCLDPSDGDPSGTAVVPANAMPEESFRDFAAHPAGGVVYAHRTEGGVDYRRVECR